VVLLHGLDADEGDSLGTDVRDEVGNIPSPWWGAPDANVDVVGVEADFLGNGEEFGEELRINEDMCALGEREGVFELERRGIRGDEHERDARDEWGMNDVGVFL